MRASTLVLRGLVHRWRTGVATAAGAAVATAVLVSALGAGDSVRASLRSIAMARLGRTEYALEGGEIAGRLGGRPGRRDPRAVRAGARRGPGPDEVLLNEPLAKRLGVGEGDEVLLRMQLATTMPADAPLAAVTDTTTTLRLTVSS